MADQLPAPDHDTIVMTKNTLDIFLVQYHQDTKDTKENMLRMVADLKDGYIHELSDHKIRLEKIEQQQTTLQMQMDRFIQTANIWRMIAGGSGALLFWVLTQLPAWISLIMKH